MCARRRTFFWRNPLRGLSCAAKVRCAHGALVLKHSSPKRRQKKAKEGDPTVCVPALRFGQPAVLASSGVSLKLASFHCAQTVASPDPLAAVLLGAYRGAGEQNNQHPLGPSLRSAPSRGRMRLALCRPGRAQRRPVWLLGCSAVWLSTPCGCACGGAVAGWHARRSARAS